MIKPVTWLIVLFVLALFWIWVGKLVWNIVF